MDPITTLLVVLLLVPAIVGSVVAGLYVLHVYHDEQGWQNPLFRDLVRLDLLCISVGLGLLLPALVAVLDLPRLPLTGPAVVLGIALLLLPPIAHARRMYALRKAGKPATTTQPEEDR